MIPQIDQSNIESCLASLSHNENFAQEILNTIEEENPILYSMMQLLIDNHPKPDYVHGYMVGMSQCYTLIRRQMESDGMNETWG